METQSIPKVTTLSRTYAQMNVLELREKLRQRGLKVHGPKKALLRRLRSYDYRHKNESVLGEKRIRKANGAHGANKKSKNIRNNVNMPTLTSVSSLISPCSEDIIDFRNNTDRQNNVDHHVDYQCFQTSIIPLHNYEHHVSFTSFGIDQNW